MSRLEFLSRPLVAFDPYNKDHRRYYAEFVELRGWGHCPVRFICTEEHGNDLPMMIKNSLIQYYIDREFSGGRLLTERANQLAANAEDFRKKSEELKKELKKPFRK